MIFQILFQFEINYLLFSCITVTSPRSIHTACLSTSNMLRALSTRLCRQPFYQPLRTLSTAPSADSSAVAETVLRLRVDKASLHPAVLRAISEENASRSEKRLMRKQLIIDHFRRSESDTGSAEVQSTFFSWSMLARENERFC